MSTDVQVVALAGRRIDAHDASVARFPLSRVDGVALRLRELLTALHATTLVCSAANGADLVALRVARELGMQRRIVLPFDVERFRLRSVVDRPAGPLWGWLFDDLVREARQTGDLVILQHADDDGRAFEAANQRIIDDALALAGDDKQRVAGIAVWEGTSRGAGDITAAFVGRMQSLGHTMHIVPLDEP